MTKFVPLTCLCILMLCTILKAQSPAGSFSISAGIGVVPAYTGKTTNIDMIPLTIEAGYHITNAFSLNAYAGYTEASSTPRVLSDGIESMINNKTTLLGMRAKLHKNFTDKIEMYGGATLGYAFFNTIEKDMRTGETVSRTAGEPTPYNPNAPQGQVIYSGFVGGKYWVSKSIGVYSEIGLGVSLINAGFSLKF